ncbi:class II peroxidase [Didymella exigua CBS 183.55]|uniref:Peroxidase n=1 Tax=Didymella exigua CBS 183.55 TaxID=1150837 RepID=A0A6A5RY94_9PLEO|nr:class II peroxidase [Didymella exigua CBS 183.55]KAF1932583.1 class II peroxidase [Didymella exigua CBS 183.55]
MKLSLIVVAGLGALTVFECTYAYPGMGATVDEVKQRIQGRQQLSGHQRLASNARRQTTKVPDPNDTQDPNAVEDVADAAPKLIGDIKDGGTTAVGKAIARIITEQETGQSSVGGYQIPGSLGTFKCKADTCCVWAHISLQLTNIFRGQSGRCKKYARAAIRLGFHDAGTWKDGLDFGGADGSIILAKEEISRPDNKGLQDIVRVLGNMYRQTFKQYGIGVADLIQFAAKHAVVTCPLGPRIRTFVGRKDSSRANMDGLLPGVNDSADTLIALFAAKTIGPHELTALLGAHTASQQFHVDPSRAAAPQDGTPGVWDTLFYNQTLGLGPLPKAVFRFPSDVVLAQDPRTRDEWRKFSIGREGQEDWNEDYAYSYIRLSLLGVNNINQLTECTKVLPMPTKSFRGAGDLLIAE